jgi:tetratricopeptide (TPR) repeat protein
VLGLEPTSFTTEPAPDAGATLDIEPTAFEVPRAPQESIIEPEASSTLLPDSDLLDSGASDAPTDEHRGELMPLREDPAFEQQTNDPLGFGFISHDSSTLDIDLPPPDSNSPDNVRYWQSSEHSPFDANTSALDEDPPLLRSDAIGMDDPIAQGGADPSNNGAGPDLPLIDFDTSSLESAGLGTFGVGSKPQSGPAGLRRHTISAERSVSVLQSSVEDDPENWPLRRELAEAMLESGDREGGVKELEAAMMGAERANELDLASSLAEEIARLAPDTVRIHQKRVEYAFRTNDKLRLIEAYLALAGALLNSQQAEKARAVYQRVLDLAPDDIRAQAALESLAAIEAAPPEPPPPARKGAPRAPGAPASPVRTRSADPAPTMGDGSFVNLGDLLRNDDGPRSTRMIVEEEEPTGDEEADFADMLKKFKQGIAENVAQEDYQSHYDLGVAFKEMGLLDEAIAEFQKALKAPSNRLPTYEALGQCFLEKEQHGIALTVLARALHEKGHTDDDLVGLLYLLGRAAEALHRNEEALSYYQRVFVVDIEFRDIAERISELERIAR